jgi:dihydroorotase/N-acyl-D-amino-acid deacylase
MRLSYYLILFSCLFLSAFTACTNDADYDVIIRNGQIYDGSLEKPLPADIGIKGEMIAVIGDLSEKTATKDIDATGLAVAPGFIDMHVHLGSIRELPEMESLLRQGVTTALGGPDGGGPWPFGPYLDSLEAMGIGANVAYLVGHNTIRSNVLALEDRKPNADELQEMQDQVEQAMKEGAFGISTGLKYVPGTFSEVDEVIALSRVASQHGGIYTSHLREEGLGVIGAVAEAISISEKADIPVVLTHHKVMGPGMWGKSTQTLAMVDSARNRGLDIMLDQYPYAASQTGISVLLPPWSRSGGQNAFLQYIDNPLTYDSVRQGVIYNIVQDRTGGDLHRIQFARIPWQPELEGKSLHDWLLMREKEPTPANAADLVIEAQAKGGGAAVYHVMDQGDVDRIMQHPQTMIASDAQIAFYEEGQPHPRWYGTFPRVLGHYVRERGILTLEEAIHKMTMMPANRLGLSERGRIAEGAYADLVIFDPKIVIDQATFEQPHQYPLGIPYVLVNGQVVVDAEAFRKIRAGKVLRGQAYQE